MSKVLVDTSTLNDIASAIQDRSDSYDQIKGSDFAEAIRNIPAGGYPTIDLAECMRTGVWPDGLMNRGDGYDWFDGIFTLADDLWVALYDNSGETTYTAIGGDAYISYYHHDGEEIYISVDYTGGYVRFQSQSGTFITTIYYEFEYFVCYDSSLIVNYETPSIDVSTGGLITASANEKSNTKQLTVQAGKTVTPTKAEQTAVSSQRFTTGDVKVGAIPDEYIVPSGSETKNANGTYNVTSLSQLVVNVPTGTARSQSDLTASGATVTVPAGLYSSQATKSVATATLATPSASKGSVSNHSVTITPTITQSSGYVTGATKNGTAVTVSASELVSGNLDISSNGSNIDVKNYATVSVNVPTSGGSSKNVQCYQGYATVTSTSYTATAVSLTVAKTGTYTVSWMGYRNTNSGTSGSQLYIGSSAYGSAQTSFVNTYGHSVKLTNVSLTAGQTITVRARARSTSYVMGVGNLTIVEN